MSPSDTASRRNPYLILGVDYGASTGEANKAFSRSSRRLKRSADAPYDIEDLTWALNQVEHVNSQPDASVDYFRVPADPTAYRLNATEGVMLMSVEVLDRRTPPVTEEELWNVVRGLLRDAALALINELPLRESLYGLGVDLAAAPVFNEPTQALSAAVEAEQQRTLQQIAAEAHTYGPADIDNVLSRVYAGGIRIPVPVAIALIRSPGSSDAAITYLAHTVDDAEVARAAADAMSRRPEGLGQLANTPVVSVRLAVAAHPLIPVELRKALRRDPDPGVAQAAKQAARRRWLP